jgi:hypothetical protein
MTDSLNTAFETWIDGTLTAGAPSAVVAFNFNIYEDADAFSVELIGTSSFDEEDSDWACDDIWNAAVQRFRIPFQVVGSEWRTALAKVEEWLIGYLASGSQGAVRLKESEAVAVGFVDGDLELLWRKAQPSIQTDASGAV